MLLPPNREVVDDVIQAARDGAGSTASADSTRINHGTGTIATESRRGYSAVDMRLAPCVNRRDDQVLVGEACTAGIIVYGPYVPVPAGADIEVTFAVQSRERLEVHGDIVSQMGQRILAGVGPEVLEAGSHRRFNYRVRAFAADKNVETRIGIRSEHPTHFEISNLTMTVK